MLPEDSPVSTRSYWRYWLSYGPAMALRDGKLRPQGYRYVCNWGIRTANMGRTPPPPQSWTAADFDDSCWPVSRVPMNTIQIGLPGWFTTAQHHIRQTFLRTRFIVPDPDRVEKFVFTAVFHGGLIVHVNGREIARKHIPADGPLADECYAEPFPEEACGPVTEEMKKLGRKLRVYRSGKGWTYSYFFRKFPRDIVIRVRELMDRRVEVEVPKETLKKGINVLALELRLSPGRNHCPDMRGGWPHGVIRYLTLDAEPDNAVQGIEERPEGVQVWADDIHRRVMTEDYLEPGVNARRTLRLVGARGGRYSAQVLIGTTGDLASPSAKLSGLSEPGGAEIPVEAVSLRWGRPLDLAEAVLNYRRTGRSRELSSPLRLVLIRYRKAVWDSREREERLVYPDRVVFSRFGKGTDFWKDHGAGLKQFDRLSREAPGKVPAGECQPLWVTAEIPADAKPGLYTGNITVSAGGMETTSLPIRLQVFDWKLPAPKEYTSYSGMEESPVSLATWADVKLWSEEHWKLVEESIRWCGKLGARVAVVPAVQGCEVDNGKHTMVRWVSKGNGTYAYDFSIIDRYLDLWRKYCHKKSDVIVHILATLKYDRSKATSKPGTVVVADPATGAESTLTPIDKEVTPEGLKLWKDFSRALRTRLNDRGFADEHIMFGMFHDKAGEANEALIKALHKEIPEVGWARASHYGGKKGMWADKAGKSILHTVKWDAARRAAREYAKRNPSPFGFEKRGDPASYRVRSHKGWKNPEGPLNTTMNDSDFSGLALFSPSWQTRLVPEMLITTAYRGYGLACIDGFDRAPRGYGPFIRWLVYPAENGVMDGSARFEALCEGLQDAEVRIFLEGKDDLPKDIQAVLDDRVERGWQLPSLPWAGCQSAENHLGWQERSWDLYAAATQVAGGSVPGEEEKKRFFEE